VGRELNTIAKTDKTKKTSPTFDENCGFTDPTILRL
jgi:hypothetical protein